MYQVTRTERGWGAHFIGASRCGFRRNTLLECVETSCRIIISTVGNYRYLSGDCSSIGFNRYYETMAFYAEFEGEYIEADVSREIPFNSKWFIGQDEYVANKGSIDNKANDMHENVVKELYTRLVTYGLIDMKHINP